MQRRLAVTANSAGLYIQMDFAQLRSVIVCTKLLVAGTRLLRVIVTVAPLNETADRATDGSTPILSVA